MEVFYTRIDVIVLALARIIESIVWPREGDYELTFTKYICNLEEAVFLDWDTEVYRLGVFELQIVSLDTISEIK